MIDKQTDTAYLKMGNNFYKFLCIYLKTKKELLAKLFSEPRVGLEPTTYALRMRCSTN